MEGVVHKAFVIQGNHTEILMQVFADAIMVMVTQLEKPGTILRVTSEVSGMGGRVYDVSTLLGRRDDPLLVIYARQLAEQLRTDKPVLLAIGLKEEGRDSGTFQSVIQEVLGMVA